MLGLTLSSTMDQGWRGCQCLAPTVISGNKWGFPDVPLLHTYLREVDNDHRGRWLCSGAGPWRLNVMLHHFGVSLQFLTGCGVALALRATNPIHFTLYSPLRQSPHRHQENNMINLVGIVVVWHLGFKDTIEQILLHLAPVAFHEIRSPVLDSHRDALRWVYSWCFSAILYTGWGQRTWLD